MFFPSIVNISTTTMPVDARLHSVKHFTIKSGDVNMLEYIFELIQSVTVKRTDDDDTGGSRGHMMTH